MICKEVALELHDLQSDFLFYFFHINMQIYAVSALQNLIRPAHLMGELWCEYKV